MFGNFDLENIDGYDIEQEPLFETLVKPFIEKSLDQLRALDKARDQRFRSIHPEGQGITYPFAEHSENVAQMAKEFALELGLSQQAANNIYWATLVHDIGKLSLKEEIWDTVPKPSDELKALRRAHVWLGADRIHYEFDGVEHDFINLMVDIAKHHHEQHDGLGTLKLSQEQVSDVAKIITIVDSFDGLSRERPHFEQEGKGTSVEEVLERMTIEKKDIFNPEFLAAFETMMLEKQGHPAPKLEEETEELHI